MKEALFATPRLMTPRIESPVFRSTRYTDIVARRPMIAALQLGRDRHSRVTRYDVGRYTNGDAMSADIQ